MDTHTHHHAIPTLPGPGNLTRPGISAEHFGDNLRDSLASFAPAESVEESRPEKAMIVAVTFSAYETVRYESSYLHDPRYLEAQAWGDVAKALGWEFRHLEIPCEMSFSDHYRTSWLSVQLMDLMVLDVGEGGRMFVWVGAEGCADIPQACFNDRKMEGPWIIRWVGSLAFPSPLLSPLSFASLCTACWTSCHQTD